MYPDVGEVLHFSEDPAIARFEPRHIVGSDLATAVVWAVDAARAPDYWFPRECPRVLGWVRDETDPSDTALLGGTARVHVIERGWLDAMRSVRLYAYRLDAAAFAPIGEPTYAHICERALRPLRPPEPIGDLVELHARAGIELRAVEDLWPIHDRWSVSSLGFSAIRMRNARRGPRSAERGLA